MELNTAFEIYDIAAIVAGIIVAIGLLFITAYITAMITLPIYIRTTKDQFKKDEATEILSILKFELI